MLDEQDAARQQDIDDGTYAGDGVGEDPLPQNVTGPNMDIFKGIMYDPIYIRTQLISAYRHTDYASDVCRR